MTGDDLNTVKFLEPDKIVETIRRLHSRIGERFPKSGLHIVCRNLEEIGVNAKKRGAWIGKPILWIRILVTLGCLVFLATTLLLFYLGFQPLIEGREWEVSSLLTNVEIEINFMILIGGATLFLSTIESRYKRWRALQALHELRSVAHIIDMHQLTKDPDRLLYADATRTSSSPEFQMNSYELRRYLDYCSEMLSLTGKIAALYVQQFDDPVALASASEIESMTTGLSRKIWQKLLILHTVASSQSGEVAAVQTVSGDAEQRGGNETSNDGGAEL